MNELTKNETAISNEISEKQNKNPDLTTITLSVYKEDKRYMKKRSADKDMTMSELLREWIKKDKDDREKL